MSQVSLDEVLARLKASDPDPAPAAAAQAADRTMLKRADATQEVDWGLVVRLRQVASEQITSASQRWFAEHGLPMPAQDKRMMGRATIRAVVRNHAEDSVRQGQSVWPLAREHAVAAAVENAIFGYGRLQPLFEIPTAENIEVHGHDGVFVQYGDGHRETHSPVADSDEELVEAIRFLGESANPPRRFDDAHPMMTLGDSQNSVR